MVCQQNSAQAQSLRTDQKPISTIFLPKRSVKPFAGGSNMSVQTHDLDESAHTFATTLRQRRSVLKLSLAKLADRVGCAKSYLSSIENGHKGPPAEGIIDRLEQALSFDAQELHACARWDQTPVAIREDLEAMRLRDQSARSLVQLLSASEHEGGSLDDLLASGELRKLIDSLNPQSEAAEDSLGSSDSHNSQRSGLSIGLDSALPMEVPVINKVTAGYPADFSDMGYPARIADDYIRTPDLADPDAFAARVVGDSMEPNYQEGDIVVFSPVKEVVDGMDCFVRLEPDHESTFKRIYFQTDVEGNELIRIQPINNRYPPMTVPREQVAGLYAGVSVMRTIG